jgi:hypothetical protein
MLGGENPNFLCGEYNPMMNPSVYLREAKRIEGETAQQIRPEELVRPDPVRHRGYVREKLPSGCILYKMTVRKEL